MLALQNLSFLQNSWVFLQGYLSKGFLFTKCGGKKIFCFSFSPYKNSKKTHSFKQKQKTRNYLNHHGNYAKRIFSIGSDETFNLNFKRSKSFLSLPSVFVFLIKFTEIFYRWNKVFNQNHWFRKKEHKDFFFVEKDSQSCLSEEKKINFSQRDLQVFSLLRNVKKFIDFFFQQKKSPKKMFIKIFQDK